MLSLFGKKNTMVIKIAANEESIKQYATELDAFFKSRRQENAVFWVPKVGYKSDDGTTFKFQERLFKRERKSGKQGFRYEFISNDDPINRTRKSTIEKSAGTLSPQDDLTVSYRLKNRVIKIGRNLESDYNVGQHVTRLHMKPPTNLPTGKSYLVMYFIPGQELREIYRHTEGFNPSRCLSLTLITLNAVNEDATKQGIIHRDLNPRNILVDEDTQAGFLIDFEFARMGAADNVLPCGTASFVAPEALKGMVHLSNDVFSIGKALAIISSLAIFEEKAA